MIVLVVTEFYLPLVLIDPCNCGSNSWFILLRILNMLRKPLHGEAEIETNTTLWTSRERLGVRELCFGRVSLLTLAWVIPLHFANIFGVMSYLLKFHSHILTSYVRINRERLQSSGSEEGGG